MNVKLYAYKTALEKLRKEEAKLAKQKGELSEQLGAMLDEDTSLRQRANKRMRLEQIGEDLRYKGGYTDELQRLIDEKEWRG